MKQGPRTVAGVREAKAEADSASKRQPSPAQRALGRGQAFLKALSELSSRGVSADHYSELAELRRQINAAIQALGAKRKR